MRRIVVTQPSRGVPEGHSLRKTRGGELWGRRRAHGGKTLRKSFVLTRVWRRLTLGALRIAMENQQSMASQTERRGIEWKRGSG